MSDENGNNYEKNTPTTSMLSTIPVELWKADSRRIPHPNYKAYQPMIMNRGLRRLFKTKTSASNYAFGVVMRYKKLLKCREEIL
jgi:hypothetical protein